MERFLCKTQILSGPGSLSALAQLPIHRLLVVADPSFYENGTAQHIAHISGAQASEIFHQVRPDPDVTLAAEGTQRVQTFRPDTVIALGGGSAMDCAKAMVYFSGTQATLIAIPTTSGSGSEVTDFAILTHDGVKHPLVDEALRPRIAILDSDLVQSLPRSLIADGGYDLIAHALEAWAATGAGQISDALALSALQTALTQLPRSFRGEAQARDQVHTAATMAGMAFSGAGLGLCHALSHALGGEFHIPHGRLNAILLPAVMECNATTAGHRYADLARRLGLSTGADSIAVRALKQALLRLRRELGLPDTLSAAGVTPAQVEAKWEALVQAALADPCCATNPRPVEAGHIRHILHQVMGHG